MNALQLQKCSSGSYVKINVPNYPNNIYKTEYTFSNPPKALYTTRKMTAER